MTRLVLVEVRRLLARRIAIIVALGVIAVVAVALYAVHDQATQAQAVLSGQDQAFEQAVQEWQENGADFVQECRDDEELEQERSGDPAVDFGCDEMGPPTAENWGPSVPSLLGQYRELLQTLVYPVLFLALAAGSTLTAAEFTHRTIGTWLTFEPRRLRVFTSKVLAGGIGGIALGVLVVTLVLLGTPAVLIADGVGDGLSSSEWSSVSWMAARVVALAGLVGLVGAALGMLLRHSAAVLGMLVGYLAVAEGILANLLPGSGPYLLSHNIAAWVQHGTQWTVFDCGEDINGRCREVVHTLSVTHGAVELGVIAVAAMLVSAVVFRGSDID